LINRCETRGAEDRYLQGIARPLRLWQEVGKGVQETARRSGELLRAHGQSFLQASLFLLGRVVRQPVVCGANAEVEMLAFQFGEGRAFPLFQLFHGIKVRHLDERGDELKISNPIVRLRRHAGQFINALVVRRHFRAVEIAVMKAIKLVENFDDVNFRRLEVDMLPGRRANHQKTQNLRRQKIRQAARGNAQTFARTHLRAADEEKS